MSEVLNLNNIKLNMVFDNKIEAIKYAGNILVENGYVKEDYIQSMLERDKDLSVYIGNNIAIPHGMPASESYIIKSGISIIQVPDGVDFDGELAYVIIGIAGKNNTHMEILEKIALVCMEEENIEIIRRAKNKEDILNIFNNF